MRKALLAVAMTAALAGCGGSSGGGDLASDAGSSSPEPAATQGPAGPAAGSSGACATLAPSTDNAVGTTDLKKKPQVEVPGAPPPCNLVVGDIVKGNGPAAKAGDQLTMKYVGVTPPASSSTRPGTAARTSRSPSAPAASSRAGTRAWSA